MAKLSFLDLTGLTIVKDNILGIISSHTSNNDIHISLEDKNKLNDAHTHGNKSILDATTASYTTEDKALVDTIINYLPLTGGTLTGAIYFGADKASYIDNDGDTLLKSITLPNNSYLLIKDKDGVAKTAIHLGSDNKYSIATGGMDNTVAIGGSGKTSKMDLYGTAINLNGATTINGTTTIKGAVNISGNTSINLDGATWTQYSLANSLRDIRLAINTSGYFGFYDKTNEKWIFQSSVNGNGVAINGQSFVTEVSTASTVTIVAKNSKRRGGIAVSDVGFFGLWDFTNDKWTMYSDASDNIFCNGALTLLGDAQTHNVIPATNATSTAGYTLGNSNFKYRYLYAYSSSIQTSDRKYKKNIEYINDNDVLSNVFDAFKPCTFYMAGGDRKHIGLIAQEVEKAMQDNGMTIDDLSFVCKDHEYKLIDETEPDGEDNREYLYDEEGNPLYVYGLKYTELHGLEINEIQKLKKKVVDLNLALSEALARIDELERKFN